MTSSVTNASSVDVQAVCWPAWDDVLMIVHNQWRRSHRIIGGDIKEDWGSGGRKSPSSVRGGAPVGGLEDEVPQKLKHFCIYNDEFCQYVEGHDTTGYFILEFKTAVYAFQLSSWLMGGGLAPLAPDKLRPWHQVVLKTILFLQEGQGE